MTTRPAAAARRLGSAVGGLVLFLSACAGADEIYLRGGGRVSGVVVSRTPHSVSIETAPGVVSFPMSRVEKIVESRSLLQTWRDRVAGLSATDLDGWVALARWAEERDLVTQARTAWERVLALDPGHPEANAALGNVQVSGRWMSREDGNRARGLVPFQDRWVSRPELDALQQERAADEAASRERRAAEWRVREAEARALEAEARAREAQADSGNGGYGSGIPIWWPNGDGGFHRPQRCCAPSPPPPQPTPVLPPPPRRPSSIGPIGAHPAPAPGAVHRSAR